MFKNSTKLALISVFIIGIFSFTYISFLKYQPKILKKVEEVKGLSTINTDDIPYPTDAIKIGFNQTPNSKQTTFQTSKTREEVQAFYKNIFSGKRWKLLTERIVDHTLTFTYQKDQETVTVVATSQEENTYTVVSVEVITK